MAVRSDGLQTEKRILQTCVRLFLENGYHQTTMLQILREAQVSSSSFQNLFRSKDGVLLELVKFMFDNQFGIARNVAGAALPPVYVYAAETAIQITLTEMNENLRQIYLEVYTREHLLDYIQRATAKELYRIFGPYQPELTEQDFYELEFGSAGLDMRGIAQNVMEELFRRLAMHYEFFLDGLLPPEK